KEINKKRMELEAIERAKNQFIENLILKKQQERELAILKQRQERELAINNQLLQKTDPSNLGHNQKALNNFLQSIFQLPVDKKENVNEPQLEDNKVKHQENTAQHQEKNLSSSGLNVYSLYNLVDGSVAKPIEKLTNPSKSEKRAASQVQNQANRASEHHKIKEAESQTQKKNLELNETEMGTRNNPIKVLSIEDFLSTILGEQAVKDSHTQNNSEKKSIPERELQQKKSTQENSHDHKTAGNQSSTKLQDNNIEKIEKAGKSHHKDISSLASKSDTSSSAEKASDVSSVISEQDFYDTILEIVKKKLEKINSDEERSQNNKVEQKKELNSSNSNPEDPRKDLDEKKKKSDKSVPEEKVVEEHVNRNDIKSIEIKEGKQEHIKDQKATKKSKQASNPQIIEKSLPEQLKASKLSAIQKVPSVERSPSIESSDTEFQNAKTKCYEQIDLLRKNIDSHEIKRHRSRKCDIKKKLEGILSSNLTFEEKCTHEKPNSNCTGEKNQIAKKEVIYKQCNAKKRIHPEVKVANKPELKDNRVSEEELKKIAVAKLEAYYFSKKNLENLLKVATSLKQIKKIQASISSILERFDRSVFSKRLDFVQKGDGSFQLAFSSTNKEFREYSELLLRELTNLDSVKSHGSKIVRSERKQAVSNIQSVLNKLDLYLKSEEISYSTEISSSSED
ncbi:hypothetical protein AYI69_g3658, partial [Smittium culicis]